MSALYQPIYAIKWRTHNLTQRRFFRDNTIYFFFNYEISFKNTQILIKISKFLRNITKIFKILYNIPQNLSYNTSYGQLYIFCVLHFMWISSFINTTKSFDFLRECQPWCEMLQNAKSKKRDAKCEKSDVKYLAIRFSFFAIVFVYFAISV